MTELLNLDDLKDLPQEEIAEKIKEANEKYSQMLANKERWAQQIIEEKKLAEKSLKALGEINGDNDKFVALYNQDKKLGEYILKNVFNGASIEEFQAGGSQRSTPTKENFEEFYQKKQVEETIEKVTSKLSQEAKEKFDLEFSDLTDGKNLTKDNVNKYIKIALKEIEPDFSEEIQEARVFAMGGWTAKPKDNKPQWDQATTDFLVQMGVVKPSK